MSAFMPVSCSFDYYSFVLSFKIMKCETDNFILFFFFEVVLAIWGRGYLKFHINLRVFSIFAKIGIEILIGIAENL